MPFLNIGAPSTNLHTCFKAILNDRQKKFYMFKKGLKFKRCPNFGILRYAVLGARDCFL